MLFLLSENHGEKLFLDKLLHEFHLSLFKSKSPNFSSLFLNAGAHIQHHYFFNSSQVESELKNPTWYVEIEKIQYWRC